MQPPMGKRRDQQSAGSEVMTPALRGGLRTSTKVRRQSARQSKQALSARTAVLEEVEELAASAGVVAETAQQS